MNINQKLNALGFDPSNHDAAVHSALDALSDDMEDADMWRRLVARFGETNIGVNAAIRQLHAEDFVKNQRASEPEPDPATLVKEWWAHVKNCDACILSRPYCAEGNTIYYRTMKRHTRPTRPGSVRVEHKDLIMRSAQ